MPLIKKLKWEYCARKKNPDDWGERNSYWAEPEGQHTPNGPLHSPEGDFSLQETKPENENKVTLNRENTAQRELNVWKMWDFLR